MADFARVRDCAEAFREVGDGLKAFCEVGDGVKAFCEAGDSVKAFYEAGDGVEEAFCEVGDGAKLDWLSPRISFSQDLTMTACDSEFSSVSTSIRVFPEKRKWQDEGGEENHDGHSAEFEFSKNDASYGGLANQDTGVMVSADELFSDGKLLPLHLRQESSSFSFFSSSPSHGDLCVHQNKLFLQGPDYKKLFLQKTHQRPMVRHLSFELPKPSSSSMALETTPVVSLSVDNSPCSSPPRPSSAPSGASPLSSTYISPKSSSKCSSKIKDFFKPKRVVSATAQLTRDNSTTSTCRIPIPPRSFWPFSRSNSAGESKTTTPPPPTLPPRSNSAGDSNAARVSLAPSNESPHAVQNGEPGNTSGTSHLQGCMASVCQETLHSSNSVPSIDAASSSQTVTSFKQPDQSFSNTLGTFEVKSTVVNATSRVRDSASPGWASRKKYMIPAAGSFSRGSPGRRGAMNSSGVKVNAGRIVLRNLERCSAEKKFFRESSGGRSSYPIAVRVTPVLNVAVYRGKMSKSGMFGFGRLFLFKKEKGKDKPMEGALNNWRAAA